MFWLLALFVIGGTYTAVDRLASPAILGFIVAAIVLGYGVMGVVWFNDQTGISNFITGSWRALSGVDSPGGIVTANCDEPTFWVLPMLLVALFNVLPGMVAIIGVPFGIIALILGGLYSLAVKDSDGVAFGLGSMFVGISGLVMSGLVMRFMHYMDGSTRVPKWIVP